jgi:phosphohistidine phosphatase
VPRLLIVRHAKAAQAVPGGDDHDRPLAPAGLAQLPDLATQVVSALGSAPLDLVLCSPAARTRETVAGLVVAAPALGDAPVRVKRSLYLAGVDDLLAVLGRVPDNVETALVCGHNPGLHELALVMLGDAADEQLRQGLPTAGLAVVDLDTNWSHISR